MAKHTKKPKGTIKMLDKIKRLIEKIKIRIFYNRCYSDMEGMAIAIFGMCSGSFSPIYRKENCSSCPYFREVEE